MRRFAVALSAFTIGVALAAAVALVAGDASRPHSPEPLRVTWDAPQSDPPVKVIRVDPRDDRGKKGRVHGVMGQRYFETPASTSRASPDQLRFEFPAPAEIMQFDVSVDINDPRLNLLEFIVALNLRHGYGLERRASYLAHVSWSGHPSSSLDETTRLPPGVVVGRGDFLGVGAWMGGTGSGDPLRVSPEVVVLYRWLEHP